MSKNIPGEALNAVRKLVELLSQRFNIKAVYIFGSYVKGTWIKTSDVDVVIVSSDFKDIPFLERLDIINEIQWRSGIRPYIEAIPLTPEEFEERLEESVVIRDASKYWVQLSFK